MSKFRVAAIQMPTVENKMENVKAVRHYLDEIRDQKIDFVVLPEMFCCPYETGKFPEYAEEEGGPVWTALSAYAKEYNTYCLLYTSIYDSYRYRISFSGYVLWIYDAK